MYNSNNSRDGDLQEGTSSKFPLPNSGNDLPHPPNCSVNGAALDSAAIFDDLNYEEFNSDGADVNDDGDNDDAAANHGLAVNMPVNESTGVVGRKRGQKEITAMKAAKVAKTSQGRASARKGSLDSAASGLKKDTPGVGKGKPTKASKSGGGEKRSGGAKKVSSSTDALDDEKREERNLREKERSFKISRQISMLRDLLSSGGVAVPKGTKSSVLTEAANYIRILQQERFNSEIERQNLVQKIQHMNGGHQGSHAQIAIREAVSSLGLVPSSSMGGVPPVPSSSQEPGPVASRVQPSSSSSDFGFSMDKPPAEATPTGSSANSLLKESDYNSIFQYSSLPMAIATMGGTFLECNNRFSQLSGFSKVVLATMTVFNIVAPAFLQQAFDTISSMIPQGTVDESGRSDEETPPPQVLKGLVKHGACDITVSLVKDSFGNAKYFCVQLTPTGVQMQALADSHKIADGTGLEHKFLTTSG